MNRCNNCKIIVYDDRENCPLCHKILDDMTEEDREKAVELFGKEAPYPNVRERELKIRFALRLILFIFLASEVVSVIVNTLVTPGIWWCIISGMGMVYLYLFIYYWVKHDSGIAFKIGLQLILTMFLVFGIDYVLGYQGWSLEWVVPGLILLGDGIVFFFMMLNRENWVSYSMLLIIFTLCSGGIMILYLTSQIQNVMLPIICIAVTGVFLMATVILGDREFTREMSRRFHV